MRCFKVALIAVLLAGCACGQTLAPSTMDYDYVTLEHPRYGRWATIWWRTDTDRLPRSPETTCITTNWKPVVVKYGSQQWQIFFVKSY